jgi:hypothetical protein
VEDRGRTTLKARVFAVVASIASQLWGHSKVTVFEALKERYDCYDNIANPNAFIDNTFQRFLDEDTFDDRPRSGRPYVVDERIAWEVAGLLKQGHVMDGKKVYYHSIHEACQFNPLIAALVEASGQSADMVFERALQADEELVVKTIEVKMELPKDVKQQRQSCAKEKLKLTWKMLFEVVFIDEMRMELTPPTKRKVICSKGEALLPEEDSRLNKKRKGDKPIVINALYAVNALMGPVHMKVLTGTTNFDSGYMVRSGQSLHVLSRQKL